MLTLVDVQGRGKKDAKQVSAAAVLEMLLVNVPESDFLMPGKAKQTKTVQPTVRAVGRQPDFGRGRGRLRPTGGRYMSQRSMADYGDNLIPAYEAPYSYAADSFQAPAGAYPAPHGNFGVSVPPSAYNVPQQQQFGANVAGMNSALAGPGGLGPVGDNRGLQAPFQQVQFGLLCCLT